NAAPFDPGTTKAVQARVVTVASGALVEAIDFSSFVPASRSPGMLALPTGTGVISGALRFPDGTPATGIPILLMSAASVPGGAGPAPAATGQLMQILQSLPPGTRPISTVLTAGGTIFTRFAITSDLNGRYQHC